MRAATVSVEPVAFDDKAALWALMEAYLIEHTRRVEPDRVYDPGGYPYFDLYWSEPERRPYWIVRDRERLGFALVTAHSPSGIGTDHGISEFCVLPAWRRQGVGMAAARAVLEAHPGQWELQVYRGNPDGVPFWPEAIAAAGATDLQVIEHDDRLVYRFQIKG